MKKLTSAVLYCVSTSLVSFVLAAGTASAARIHLAEKYELGEPAGRVCDFELIEGEHLVKDKDGCLDDEASYFMLENVPGDASISLDGEDECNSNDDRGGWRFTVETFTKLTGKTPWIKIESLKGKSNEYVVADSVWVESSIYNSGDVNGKLSCVIVKF